MNYDVIVIGEGVSGLTAAQTLAQNGFKVATLEAQLFGGLVLNVNELEPAPGERHVSGAELCSELMQVNADLGVASIQEAVVKLGDGGGLKRIETSAGTHQARHVVLASGARLKKLGIPGEAEFEGRGVSQCADCDGPMYQDEDVVVVGGGDSALQEALVLAKYCRRVHIVHRGANFRAHPRFVEQVKTHEKISIVWNARAEAILGSKMVEKARITSGDGGTQEIPCAGVFAYIGLAPNVDYLPPDIARDEAGLVLTQDTLETATSGVWAIGAVRSGYGGLLTDAIAEAKRAAQGIASRLTT